MHESTISRVTTQKYMHTPRGIFELKYFFSSHVATTAGGECSSTAIRALIKKLVAAENPRKPLSDNKITQLLEEQGIKVARRTIAKYRDTLLIPPPMNASGWYDHGTPVPGKHSCSYGHSLDSNLKRKYPALPVTGSSRPVKREEGANLCNLMSVVTMWKLQPCHCGSTWRTSSSACSDTSTRSPTLTQVTLIVEKMVQKAEATVHISGADLFARRRKRGHVRRH